MILDSTFLIDVMQAEETVAELAEEVDESGPPFVTSVTVMELYEGVHRADSTGAERQAVERVLDGITELPFDRTTAKRAGEINAELRSRGAPIDRTDVMIAAAALVNDLPVVTRNVDHFDRIDGLEVLSY